MGQRNTEARLDALEQAVFPQGSPAKDAGLEPLDYGDTTSTPESPGTTEPAPQAQPDTGTAVVADEVHEPGTPVDQDPLEPGVTEPGLDTPQLPAEDGSAPVS